MSWFASLSDWLASINADKFSSVGNVIIALVAVVGAAIAYRVQRNQDRLHEMKMKRREIYLAFVSSLLDAAQGNGDPHLRARIEASLIGSDKVLLALAEYNDYADATSPGGSIARDSVTFKLLLSEVIIQMRRDVFESSRVTAQDYAKVLPLK